MLLEVKMKVKWRDFMKGIRMKMGLFMSKRRSEMMKNGASLNIFFPW